MKIGIEAERANTAQKTGVEHYAQQLILHLAKIDSENEYTLYLRTRPERWLLELPKNFTVKVMPFPVFWTQLRVSWEILVHPVEVLFIPASALPIIHPKKSVVTIHDIAWQIFPEAFGIGMRWFLKFSTWFAVHSAWKVIAVSEATKKDLLARYHVSAQKIEVVHHGYALDNSPGAGSRQLSHDPRIGVRGNLDSVTEKTMDVPFRGLRISFDEGRGEQSVPASYILFLSTLQPRKNLERLIDAFRMLKTELPELPHRLVVVGKPGWKFESILQKIEDNKDLVVYLNHVSEIEKAYILSHADALVLPSLYEGFGMQILEAFAAGVPVATSNISSMPEVAGDAAIYFDPTDAVDIKSSLRHILLDKSLSDSLRRKGTERLKSFSWKLCAEQTLAIFTSKRV